MSSGATYVVLFLCVIYYCLNEIYCRVNLISLVVFTSFKLESTAFKTVQLFFLNEISALLVVFGFASCRNLLVFSIMRRITG